MSGARTRTSRESMNIYLRTGTRIIMTIIPGIALT